MREKCTVNDNQGFGLLKYSVLKKLSVCKITNYIKGLLSRRGGEAFSSIVSQYKITKLGGNSNGY